MRPPARTRLSLEGLALGRCEHLDQPLEPSVRDEGPGVARDSGASMLGPERDVRSTPRPSARRQLKQVGPHFPSSAPSAPHDRGSQLSRGHGGAATRRPRPDHSRSEMIIIHAMKTLSRTLARRLVPGERRYDTLDDLDVLDSARPGTQEPRRRTTRGTRANPTPPGGV